MLDRQCVGTRSCRRLLPAGKKIVFKWFGLVGWYGGPVPTWSQLRVNSTIGLFWEYLLSWEGVVDMDKCKSTLGQFTDRPGQT
jgi:hypothetical protein